MSRPRAAVLASALLLGSLGLAALLIGMRPEPARQAPPSRIPFATTVPVIAGAGPLTVHGSGAVRAREEVEVSAEVSGRIVWLDPAFRSGGRVREGQVLLRLEDADYEAGVLRARASVEIRQVELLRAEEEARIAREHYERFSSGPSPEPGPLASWEPQLRAARAAVEHDRALLAEAELRLARTAIRAPFDAIVRSESVAAGQFAPAGAPLGRLAPVDAVEVVASLADRDAALIPGLWDLRAGAPGPRIPVRVLATVGDARLAWDGVLDRIEPALDEATRTVQAIVRVPDPLTGGSPMEADRSDAGSAPPLLLGRFVDLEIEGVAPPAYYRLPRLALHPGNEVWVVRDGAVAIVPVAVLQRRDDWIFVTGALREGEDVVVGGVPFATDGLRVRTAASPD